MDILMTFLLLLMHQMGNLATKSDQTIFSKYEASDSYSAEIDPSGADTGNSETPMFVNQEPNVHNIPTADDIFKQNEALVEEGAKHARDLARKHFEAVATHHEMVAKQQETIVARIKHKTNDGIRDMNSLHQTERLKEDISITNIKDDVGKDCLSFGAENKEKKHQQPKQNGDTKQTGCFSHSSSSSSSMSDGERHFTSSSMTSGPDGVKHTWHSSDDPERVYTWTDHVKSRDQSADQCASSTASTASSNGKGSFQSSTMRSGPNGVKHTYHSSDEPDKIYTWTD